MKKIIPSRESIEKSKFYQWINKYVDMKKYWGNDNESIARGIAVGTFSAFIPLIGQSIIAIVGAIFLRANIAFSIGFTFISNPFTYAPLYWFCYQVGYQATGIGINGKFDNNFLEQLFRADTFWEIMLPTTIGGVIIGIPVALIAYFISKQKKEEDK